MLDRLRTRARCYRVARSLPSYLDGEVDSATASLVTEHLEECRLCGLEASTYAAIKTAIGSRATPRPVTIDPAAARRLDDFVRSLRDDPERRRDTP